MSTPSVFTGNSQFATDFQQVVQRAVSFASLPMQQMQNDVVELQSRSSELSALQSTFAALQSAVDGVNSALGLGSYTASVATNTVASASLGGAPTVGTYSLEVVAMGSYATATSIDGLTAVADPAKGNISDATSFTLTVGATSTTITPATTTLSSLVSAINASSAGVQATMVNVGTTASPSYRLSIQNGKLAQTTLDLKAVDGAVPGQTLLAQQANGSPTTYRVNGIPKSPAAPLASDSPTITLAPGVSVNLLAPGSTTITVARNTGSVGLALSGLASAYNAAVAEINKNRGEQKGALAGESIVQTLSDALHQITNYSAAGGALSSLTSIGFGFDAMGVLSLDTSAFNTAVQGQMPALENFLGSSAGGGFLQYATSTLKAFADPSTGIIQTDITSVGKQTTKVNNAIAEQQSRVDTLQTNLNRKMAAADAAISAMEQQYSFLSNMFESMRINAQNGG